MNTETSDSGNSGCVSAIGYIFPILLIVGILLFVLSFIIDTTLSDASPLALTEILVDQEPTPTPIVYRVQSGDTLQSIAAEFGVSPEAIQEANGIVDPQSLQIEQELIIPRPETAAEQPPTSTPTPPPPTAVPPTATPTRGSATGMPPPVSTPTPPPMVEVTPEMPGLPVTGGILDPLLPETGGVLATAATSLPTVYAKASWPLGMEFNDSDIIDLLLIAMKGQSISPGVVTATAAPQTKPASILLRSTPFPRKIKTSDPIDFADLCDIPSDYQGYAIANLDGSAFDISPQGPQREALTKLYKGQSTITWAWTITPKRSGSHKVNLSVEIEWVPLGDTPAPIVQCDVWEDQELYITVKNPPPIEVGRISLFGIGMIIFGGFGTVFRGLIEKWLRIR